MSPGSLLAEKLTAYRSMFDEACRGLFGRGESVTLEYEHDEDGEGAVDVSGSAPASPDGGRQTASAASESERQFENSNRGSDCASQIRSAVRSIAEDFAHEFNGKLAAAAREDPTVNLVSDKYEMGPEHVAELDRLLAAPVAPLLAKLAAGDLDGARRAILDVWPSLERCIRHKWQAYFVLTFQDVSVERKAARDRRRATPRFDEAAISAMGKAEATRRGMTDFGAPADERPPRTLSPWIAVAALLLLAAAGGWLLMRGHARNAAAAVAAPAH